MTREEYQSCIWEYKRRRDVANVTYSKALKVKRNLTQKIRCWQRAMNRIDERSEIIKKLVKSVNYFFNVRIQSKSMDMDHKFARSIYFKIGMENKMRGKDLAECIGRHKRSAFRNRIALTRSFETNHEKKKIFHDFKEYIEREETDDTERRA